MNVEAHKLVSSIADEAALSKYHQSSFEAAREEGRDSRRNEIMGTRTATCVCHDCEEEFQIVLEWMTNVQLIEAVQNTQCPECGSDNWILTDESTI